MTNVIRRSLMVAAVLGVVAGAAAPARANLLINGDFETGNLSGWTPFTTANGNNGIGLPDVVPFDTTGGGTSNSARFEVGQVNFNPGVFEGGGISQVFAFGGGTLNLSADVAALGFANQSGGRFELLLNNAVLSTFQVNVINAGQTIRGQLSATESGLAAGSYTLAIRITRPFTNGAARDVTPYQFVDNVNAVAVPEPATLTGAGVAALFGLTYAWRRRRTRLAA
jgi:hypothetical protein